MLNQMICLGAVMVSIVGFQVTRRKVAEAELFEAGAWRDWFEAEQVFRTTPSYLADVETKYLIQQYIYGQGVTEYWQAMHVSCIIAGAVGIVLLLGPFLLPR